MNWLNSQAKQVFLGWADQIKYGSFELVCPDRTYAFTAPAPGPAIEPLTRRGRV